MKFFKFLFSLFFFSITLYSKNVYYLEIEGVIDPVVADYVKQEFKTIPDGDTIIIRLNTPGGLMESMQDIVTEFLNKKSPVIVWVGPEGAKAASAGMFITMAADIAAMAENTSIGAAHPVSMGMGAGKLDETMKKKITEDALAYIRSLAKRKNRNVELVEKTVKDAKSVNSEEALKQNIIDFIANSYEEVLKKADKLKIIKQNQEFLINTKNYKLIRKKMPAIKKFLHSLAHPNIAFILLMIGIYGLIYEASSPGIGFGLVLGTLSLILAFFSLKLLPINLAGVLLIIAGIILMFLDVILGTFGVLALGGIVSLILGGMMLMREGFLSVSPYLLFPTAIILAGFTLFVLGSIIKSMRKKPATGKEGLIGLTGKVLEDIDGDNPGIVFVRGEYWEAISSNKIDKGEKVIVKEVVGNILKVEEI